MTSFEVRAPSAPSHTSDDGAWPSTCFHGWKWSLTKAESKPVFSASTAKSSSLAGANCSADALYPSFSTVIVPQISLGESRSTSRGGVHATRDINTGRRYRHRAESHARLRARGRRHGL